MFETYYRVLQIWCLKPTIGCFKFCGATRNLVVLHEKKIDRYFSMGTSFSKKLTLKRVTVNFKAKFSQKRSFQSKNCILLFRLIFTCGIARSSLPPLNQKHPVYFINKYLRAKLIQFRPPFDRLISRLNRKGLRLKSELFASSLPPESRGSISYLYYAP